MLERKESQGKLYKIPVRAIVANTNPRNPLSRELQKLGWTVFGLAPPPGPAHPTLWEMATSENLAERQTYVTLIQQFDPELAALAANILALGLLEPVEVRDNGKAGKEASTYTLVFGCRRCLATLYNWCVLGKPSEPWIEAKLVKGNNVTLMHRAVSENIRLQPNPIEEAKALQYALNNGESKEELAKIHGLSEQTIDRRLALLELPVDVQRKIAAGALKPTKALQEKKQEQPGTTRVKVRPRKEIEAALGEFSNDTLQARILAWVLGQREDF